MIKSAHIRVRWWWLVTQWRVYSGQRHLMRRHIDVAHLTEVVRSHYGEEQ